MRQNRWRGVALFLTPSLPFPSLPFPFPSLPFPSFLFVTRNVWKAGVQRYPSRRLTAARAQLATRLACGSGPLSDKNLRLLLCVVSLF